MYFILDNFLQYNLKSNQMKKITLLGTGLIGTFYTMSLHSSAQKGSDS